MWTRPVLVLSVTVNVVTVTSCVVSRLLGCWARAAKRRAAGTPWITQLAEFHEDRPEVLPRIIVDQLLTWILILGALCSSSGVLREPFLFNEHSLGLYVLFAINAGRYAYKTAHEILSTDRAPTWYIHVIHHVVALLSFSVMAVCREDALLGLTCILMEAHTVFYDISYVLRKIDVPAHHRCHLVVAALGFGACVVARALLPVTLLGVAVGMHSPLRMSPVPLSVLFTSIIFFALVNVWTVRQTAVALLRCVRARQIRHLETALQLKRCPPADVLVSKSACNALSNNDVVTYLKNELHAGEMLKPACANANVATAPYNKNGHKTRIDDILLEVTCMEAAGDSEGTSHVWAAQVDKILTDRTDTTRADHVRTTNTYQERTINTDQERTINTDHVRTTNTDQERTLRADQMDTVRTDQVPTTHANQVPTIRTNQVHTIHTNQIPTIRTDHVATTRTKY